MIIFLFSFFSSIIFFLITKSFYYWKVIGLTVVLSLLLLRKKDITFDFFRELFNPENKKIFFYSCLIFLIFFTFAYFEGFDEGQDARSDYLPFARYLSLNHELPLSLDADLDAIKKIPLWRTTYPPVLYGMGAFLFQITGLYKEWIASLVPLSFSFLFLVVVFRWSYNYSQKLTLSAIAVLVSPFFVNRMAWFYQESLLTFAVTLLFYCLYRFENNKKKEYLYSAMSLSAIALMTKFTGILVCLFLVYFIFSRKLYSKSNLMALFLFHIPPILWYGNVFYIWGNPFPLLLNSLTIYKSTHKIIDAILEIGKQLNFNKWYSIIFGTLSLPFIYVWVFLEIFSFKKINKTSLEKDIYWFLIIFLSIWFFTYARVFDFRFLMPFYGYIIVRSAKLLKDITDSKRQASTVINSIKTVQSKMNEYTVAVILSLIVFVIAFQYGYVRWVFPNHAKPYLNAIGALKREEALNKEKQLLILIDTDHGFRWYGNFAVTEPFQPHVAIDYLKAQKNGNIFNFVKKHNITHIVNSPWKSPWEDNFYGAIEKDDEHFIKVYEKDSMVIWRVKAKSNQGTKQGVYH